MTKTLFESKDNSECQGANIKICEVVINRALKKKISMGVLDWSQSIVISP
jgi:hypothetical protein